MPHVPAWWLDELAHAGAEHRDAAYVARYDRKAGADPTGDVAALGHLGMGHDSTLVDLGAGTGTFAVAAARGCRRVVAVDVSPVMARELRARVKRLGLANVDVVDAGFLSYEHRGAPVDFVYTRNALHHLPDFWKGIALQRLATMLRPGGVLFLRDLVFDFAPADADTHIEEWFATAVGDAADGYTAAELAEHVRGEFSTYSWLLEALLDRTGFDVVERTVRRSVYARYVCVRRSAAPER